MKTVKYTHNFLHKYMQNLQRGRMKYIFLNLKRFDVTKENGGVNALTVPENWGDTLFPQQKLCLLKKIKRTKAFNWDAKVYIIKM